MPAFPPQREAPPPIWSVDTWLRPKSLDPDSETSDSPSVEDPKGLVDRDNYKRNRQRRSPSQNNAFSRRIRMFSQTFVGYASLAVSSSALLTTCNVLVQANGAPPCLWSLTRVPSWNCAPFQTTLVWPVQSTFGPSTLLSPFYNQYPLCTVAFVFETGSWRFNHLSFSARFGHHSRHTGVQCRHGKLRSTTCKCLCVASSSKAQHDCFHVSLSFLHFNTILAGTLVNRCRFLAETGGQAYTRRPDVLGHA